MEIKTRITSECETLFEKMQTAAFSEPRLAPHLGDAAKLLYRFVRREFRVSFHTGQVERSTVQHGFGLQHRPRAQICWVLDLPHISSRGKSPPGWWS